MITPMLVQGYGAALAIIAGSLVVGRAICVLCGGRQRWWAAPLVGLAALLILSTVAIKLPGRGVTSAVICVAAFLASGVYLLWRVRPRLPSGDGLAGVLALAAASIPFLADGRVGLLGPPWDNDSAVHLLIAETLRSSRMAKLWPIPAGYPLGPHSLVATVGTALDLPLDMVFTGLLVATMCLIALAAAGLLATQALWRRVVAGVLCAFTYLVASYYGEGSFKEPIMAGMLLAFVVHLEQVRAAWGEASARVRATMVIPAGVLGAGAIYTYSYLGAAWFALMLVAWPVLEALGRPSLARSWLSWRRARAAAPWVAGIAVLGVVLLLPIAGLVRTTFQSVGLSPTATLNFGGSDLGNLPGPLSLFEALGVWTSQDFRFATRTFDHGEGAAFALAILILGTLSSLRRRQFVLPAAAISAAFLCLYTAHTQSAYVAAKALVVGAPVFMAVSLRWLLTRNGYERGAGALLLLVAALFCGWAAYSSYLSLRTVPVQAPEPGRELAAFHRITGDAPILFLGIDDFAAWQLRDSPVYSVGSAQVVSHPGLATTTTKPFAGLAMDFDSMSPQALDKVPYVITTNTPYASQAPANFHLVAHRTLYELWKRIGPTPPFKLFEPPGQPGAILDCHTPAGRAIAARHGTAYLMTQPVLAPGVSLAAGQAGTASLRLPRGHWEISAEYLSYFNLDFRAESYAWTMPAYLGRNGPWFAVGQVTGLGVRNPVLVKVTAQRPSPLTTSSVSAVSVYELAATRAPDTRRAVPLHDACGKYVDWYRLK